MHLMTSWAVVCDVWYLEPQTLHPGETHIEFAERWDSYNKSFQFQTFPSFQSISTVQFLL
jgi:hypothetical protein